MTEYDRSATGKIQAGLTLKVGKLLSQYGDLTRHLREEEKYDATLLICALQTLLTNCSELLNAMKDRDKVMWKAAIDNGNGELGISNRYVTKNSFPGGLTCERFVEHLRNAVSHPTTADHKPFLPSTGYTTVPNPTGVISKFVFIDSPWIDRGRFRSSVTSKEQDAVESYKARFLQRFLGHESIATRNCGDDIELTIVQNLDGGKYEIRCDGVAYYPIFEAAITVSQLTMLAIKLANYIAQPTRDDWDGKTIHRLIAA